METIMKNLANLIKVKTIVTMVVVVIFAVLALKGTIEADNVMHVVTTVIAFYFGTQHEGKANAAVSAAEEKKTEVS